MICNCINPSNLLTRLQIKKSDKNGFVLVTKKKKRIMKGIAGRGLDSEFGVEVKIKVRFKKETREGLNEISIRTRTFHTYSLGLLSSL